MKLHSGFMMPWFKLGFPAIVMWSVLTGVLSTTLQPAQDGSPGLGERVWLGGVTLWSHRRGWQRQGSEGKEGEGAGDRGSGIGTLRPSGPPHSLESTHVPSECGGVAVRGLAGVIAGRTDWCRDHH